MEKTTLVIEARIVTSLFKEVRDNFELLRPSEVGPDDLPPSPVTAIDDQCGRFRIFASNLGVFAPGHASLDWRLRQSEDALDLTRQLLRSLQFFLRRAIQAYGAQAVGSGSATVSSYAGTDDSVSTSVESTVLSDASGALTGDTSAIEASNTPVSSLGGIEETVDRLYRLSWLIRTPAAATQNAKAADYPIRDEEGNDAEAAFEEYAAKVVKHRCPDATLDLVARMAQSITTRRKRLLYRKHHQSKLNFEAKDMESTHTSQPAYATPTPSAIFRNLQELDLERAADTQTVVTKPQAPAPSATSASVFTNSQLRRTEDSGMQSVISTAIFLTDNPMDTFQLPPPPKDARRGKEFECPYCYVMMPVEEAKPSRWKQHFLQDLDPFICLYSDCHEPNLMFGDVKSWLQHMQWAHARQWCCSSPGHERLYFQSGSEYEAHMSLAHVGAFSAIQLPMLTKRAEVAGAALKSCPFCNTVDAGLSEQPHQIAMHVANHLRSLALISLPAGNGNDDEDDPGTASRHANESGGGNAEAMQDDLSSLSFNDSKSPALQEEHRSAILFDDQSSQLSGGKDALRMEWGFVEVASDYVGHDRDPILQTFLRQLYLQSSPTMSGVDGPSLPCWKVPFAENPRFFGRDHDFVQVEEVLIPFVAASRARLPEPTSNPKTFVIYGPGGMGKTQLAVEFAHRHKHNFDAVLWAHGDDSVKLLQDFNTMAWALGLVAEDSVDGRDLVYTRELVKRWLVDPLKDVRDPDSSKASWLLVFDAVEDSKMLNDFWPYDGPGSILITSRSAFGWSSSLQLMPFSVEEATNYLIELTGRTEDEERRSEVAIVSQKLGGLPLALTQMASVISKGSMTFAQFARAYNERESQQELLWAESVTGPEAQQYEHSIASVFALENIRHGLALLNTCSMFDPDGISERLYTANLGKADLAGLPRTMAEYQQAKNELLGSSIVTSEKGSGKLCVHRLVQDVARMRLSQSKLRETFMACLSLVSNIWPFSTFTWRHGVERWSACEELWPHVVRLREVADQYRLFPSADDPDGDYAFARLLTDAGWYHHERGQASGADGFNDVAEKICRTWLHQEESRPVLRNHDRIRNLHATLSEITHNRGCIVSEINQPTQAFTYFSKFHNAMEEAFEHDSSLVKHDMRLAISWNELGNAHMLMRQWRKGEECFQNSIKTMRLLDDCQPSTLSLPVVNLGLAYWLQNRLDEALEILTQGLIDREEAFGINDRISFITGRYLHALGNVVGTMGDQERALAYHRRALFHYKATLGNGHHRTTDVFVKVAEHSIRIKQHENAKSLLDHALKAYSDRDTSHGTSSYIPEKARATWLRSLALRAIGKLEEAEADMEEAEDLLAQITGRHTDLTAASLPNTHFNEAIAFWSL